MRFVGTRYLHVRLAITVSFPFRLWLCPCTQSREGICPILTLLDRGCSCGECMHVDMHVSLQLRRPCE